MRGYRWAICLWPGLAPLWVQGAWAGLATAVGFALLLDSTLLATVVWTELTGPVTRNVAWLTVACIWLGSLPLAVRWLLRQGGGGSGNRLGDLFKRAQSEYLQGHWLEAQACLVELLRRDPRDIDARFLLASLYRHMGDADRARVELRKLERYEAALKWQWEIKAEQVRLAEMSPRVPEIEGAAEVERVEPSLRLDEAA